jgi:uncharacterized protein (DUF362 family)
MAAAVFGAPLVAATMGCRDRTVGFFRLHGRYVAATLLAAGAVAYLSRAANVPSALVVPPSGYRATVFSVPHARGPEADDVVLIKINAQWAERGGTNTDVLRGLLRTIVEHPDGFPGEIVVVDNGQGSGNLNRDHNNAEDIAQSVQDVVGEFYQEGWRVSAQLWDPIRAYSVGEYADGNLSNGYFVSDEVDPQTSIRVSYPKFQTAFGTCISYKYGIWEPATARYLPEKLVVVNVPVLKTHPIYGITASVKNHMGVITQSQGTDSHNGVARGGLGSVLADVRMPDLTILDCVWVLARPRSGPAASYAQASRRDQLVASRDPVALDVWAASSVLIPEILRDGFSPDDYSYAQDPENPESVFRRYLDHSLGELLSAGIASTNDPEAVEVRIWAGDLDRDGDVDLPDAAGFAACMAGPNAAGDADCDVLDSDDDFDLDLCDWAVLTASIGLMR